MRTPRDSLYLLKVVLAISPSSAAATLTDSSIFLITYALSQPRSLTDPWGPGDLTAPPCFCTCCSLYLELSPSLLWPPLNTLPHPSSELPPAWNFPSLKVRLGT